MYIRKSIRGYKGKTYTNYVLVESVHTAKGPRQKTVCSLGDLSPRPRAEWLKLARKIEDALVGQDDLLDAADGEVADIVRRVRARRADRGEVTPAPSLSRTARGALIKVDPSRVTTERHREAGPVHVGQSVLAAPRPRPHSARLRAVRRRATAGLCDGAQSLDRAVLRTRHAGLDPAHRTRRHSRRRLRWVDGRPALRGARQALSAPRRH